MSSLSYFQRYLYHQITSQSEYKIHSPFVYEFYIQVLKGKTLPREMEAIENRRKALLKDKGWIMIEDLGAGSRTNKGILEKRKISEMAKNALKPPYLAQILGRMALFMKVGSILELGTCFGITTAYFSAYASNANIITLEGSDPIAEIAKDSFSQLGLENIRLIQGNFDNHLTEALRLLKSTPKLFYLDGNHRKEPTLRYYEEIYPFIGELDIMILDDIHWSEEMESAWETLKAKQEVLLSLDLFYFGILFFQKNRTKEDFRLRLF